MILKWYRLSMKLLTRNTDYAVRAICYMAKRGEGVISVTELVKSLKIPRPFLRKILQTLNKKGIVRSSKGIGGGFRLAVAPGKIYLVDLIKVFQGPLKDNKGVERVKAGEAFPMTNLGRMDWLLEGVIGQAK